MGTGKEMIVFRRTSLISFGLLAFLIGLALSRIFYLGQATVYNIGILCLTTLLSKRGKLSMLSIIVIGLTFGCLRGSHYLNRLRPYSSLAKRPVVINAVAVSDSVYADRGQLSFDVGSIQATSPYSGELVGTMAIKGYGESMIYRGDKITIAGKIYPTRGGRQASIGYAQFSRTEVGKSKVDVLRRKFASGLQSVLPEPLGSFGLGILIGQRTTLPEKFSNEISIVGLTHIVAVSGYNLTIMVNLAHRLARKRSKYQSTALTICLIGSFLLITGISASIVRAAFVSILSLWAWYYGRKIKPTLLILFAAAVTAGIFPPYLWSDIGWYLSFLAFAGVLIIGPLITRRFFKSEPKAIASMLIETCSAQLLTLPIIMYIFGKLSLISLIANMLVVPLVPLAMGLCFVAGLAAMIIPAMAGWFAWPATLLMIYIVDVIHIFAALPKASINIQLNTSQLVFSYSLICLVILTLWKKTTKNGNLTDRKQLI